MNGTSKLLKLTSLFLLGITLCFFTACGGGSDDDGDEPSGGTTSTESGGESTGSDGGDSGGVDPSARPALARIIVSCDAGTGPITVFINGDDLGEKILPANGGEIFSNTILGNVTFSADAEGVTFSPVTLNMTQSVSDSFQVVNLNCTPTAVEKAILSVTYNASVPAYPGPFPAILEDTQAVVTISVGGQTKTVGLMNAGSGPVSSTFTADFQLDPGTYTVVGRSAHAKGSGTGDETVTLGSGETSSVTLSTETLTL